MRPDRDATWRGWKWVALSLLIHAALLLVLTGMLHRRPKLVAYRLPGTAQGVQPLTYYAPGSAKLAVGDAALKVRDKSKPVAVSHTAVTVPEAATAPEVSAERGIASSGQSGLGDGNITIALEKYFPYPTPSLATLAKGAAGDVILKAVIDEHGKIRELTLVEGLGQAIDNDVIATVNRWIYIPATKDGVPVSSVAELHFHYERRG
jgi:protein TonB